MQTTYFSKEYVYVLLGYASLETVQYFLSYHGTRRRFLICVIFVSYTELENGHQISDHSLQDVLWLWLLFMNISSCQIRQQCRGKILRRTSSTYLKSLKQGPLRYHNEPYPTGEVCLCPELSDLPHHSVILSPSRIVGCFMYEEGALFHKCHFAIFGYYSAGE